VSLQSRKKGSNGELEFARLLNDRFGPTAGARRSQQYMGTAQSADITSNLPFHFEVKRCERLQFRDWWSQLQSEATDKIGVLAFRWNNGPWIIAMGVDDWCGLVRESEFCCANSASETKTET
tara:strand:+ start:31 stop:396 length:366 start_codon:yes stop_codon:yes gene_type:complete